MILSAMQKNSEEVIEISLAGVILNKVIWERLSEVII